MRLTHALCGLLLFPLGQALAQASQKCSGPQIGTWTLQSRTAEDLSTHKKVDSFGAHPDGYLHYGTDCRMYAIIVQEGRKAPTSAVFTDSERVQLFNGVVAYAGTYSIDGNKVSHHVDISWNQAWTGTTQVREFTIDGNVLRIHAITQNGLTGGQLSVDLVWRRLE
jgi:hypothetical protein